MAKKGNYNNLDKSPYNELLHRENDLTYHFGGQTPPGGSFQNTNKQVIGSGSDNGTTQTAGGSVVTVALKTEGNATDVWIQNFIRSINWKPKTVGFYIDGKTGYAEFSNIYVAGKAVITSGSIGGFDIGKDYIRDHLDTMGITNTITTPTPLNGNVRYWAGDTYENRDIAPFYVTDTGFLQASNVSITGGIVEVNTLDGIIAQLNLAIANQSWGQSCAFTATSYQNVNWGMGVISFSDGNDYNISAGTTGNISGTKAYVYLDLDISTTAYQKTEDITNTTGPNKAIIAVCTKNSNHSSKATYQLFGGGGGIVIDGGTLTPGSVGYTELMYPPLSDYGNPSSVPSALGQLYIDLTNQDAYIATGTSDINDWRLITVAIYATTSSSATTHSTSSSSSTHSTSSSSSSSSITVSTSSTI